MFYIGIDLGTSAVKLLLLGDDLKVHKTVSNSYPVFYPHRGWSEQNPEDWLRCTLDGIAELLQGIDASLVRGIGIGGQMHGLVMLDQNDCVIRPAILWNDGRSEAEVAYLNNVIGKKQLTKYTGNIAFAGFTAPKILWVKNNEPDNFAKIHKIMLPKDYLVYMLTGVHATDPSDASGMLLFNVEKRCWSKEMIWICGIREEMLPTVFESYQPVGRLKHELAEKYGMNNVILAAGAGDNASAAIGTGTVGGKGCTISLGTSGTVFIAMDKFRVDENNALHSFAHADGGYHLMGCILSAASCGTWWIEKVLGTEDYTAEESKVEALGDNSVFFLPYLMGERSPHNDANARGVFIGMQMDTTRAMMTQAVFEGVAFALRDSVQVARALGIPVKEIKLCGGGAKSKLWREIIANVLNVTVEVLETEEGPALGGAVLAAIACGDYDSFNKVAEQIVGIKATISPDETLVEKYERRYQQFRSFYPALKPLFSEMA